LVQTDDFSNQVSTFKAANPQILTGMLFPNHFATFLGQAAQANFRPEVCTLAAAFLFPSGVNALGDRGDGMSTEVWWTPQWGTQSSLTGQTGPQLAADWQDSTGKQWTQPLGYSHALWEVGLAALKASGDPKNREAVRDAIKSLNLDTIIGSVNFRDSKLKSVAQTQLAGGQWRKAKSGKYPYDLLITYNGTAPNIKVQAETKLLSKLS
jgi:branched-chain amino acid transport system substrate-binding protein